MILAERVPLMRRRFLFARYRNEASRSESYRRYYQRAKARHGFAVTNRKVIHRLEWRGVMARRRKINVDYYGKVVTEQIHEYNKALRQLVLVTRKRRYKR